MNFSKNNVIWAAFFAFSSGVASAQTFTSESSSSSGSSSSMYSEHLRTPNVAILGTFDASDFAGSPIVWAGVMVSPRFFSYFGLNAGIAAGRVVGSDFMTFKAPLLGALSVPFDGSDQFNLEISGGATLYPAARNKGILALPTVGAAFRFWQAPGGLAFRLGGDVQIGNGFQVANFSIGLGAAI